MAYSYDELQGSGEPKSTETKVQLAGDVVPLPITPGENAGRPQASAVADGYRQARTNERGQTDTNLVQIPKLNLKTWSDRLGSRQ